MEYTIEFNITIMIITGTNERNHNRIGYKKSEFPKTITWREKRYRKPCAIKTGNNLFIWRIRENLSADPGQERGGIKLMRAETRMGKWMLLYRIVITANLLTRPIDSLRKKMVMLVLQINIHSNQYGYSLKFIASYNQVSFVLISWLKRIYF